MNTNEPIHKRNTEYDHVMSKDAHTKASHETKVFHEKTNDSNHETIHSNTTFNQPSHSDSKVEVKNAVLITGASSGIGLEFAKIFARHGHNLVLVARSEDALNTLKKHLETNFGIEVVLIIQDLKYYNAPQAIYDAVKQKNLNINILINNAGFGTYGKFSETNLETELEMIQVNVTALTHITKLFLEDIIHNNVGRILNVASTASFQPGPLMNVYYATKAYVLSFSESLAEELSDTKIKVTTLCPGPTNTNFAKNANADNNKMFKSSMPDAKEVAEFGYDALVQGKRVAIYGVKNKTLVQVGKFLPRKLVTKLVKKMHG